MSWGVFTDKEIKPSDKHVYQSLGGVKPLWDTIVSFVEAKYGVDGEFIFYGKNFGWALRYRKSGRVLIALYPGNEEYTVQIILNKTQIEEVLESNITLETRELIKRTTMIREGTWLYLKVDEERDLDEIKTLIIARSH
ncbi:MAG: DUF3788 domain-containing protein [Methanobacterium sp. ERen5]|nr:MAG: DUF3788 domain-containing protein [Methanobacterium sp. ERen5]